MWRLRGLGRRLLVEGKAADGLGGVAGESRKGGADDLGDELDGALAGEEVVVRHAADGDHGEAAVLDLLDLYSEAVDNQ